MSKLSLNDKAKNLLDYANENRKSGLFNDINIQVGNERFPCNKLVLSCYSSYFQAMFRSEMQEQYQDTVELQGFDGKYIKMLIDYMYGETIVINNENVVQVLGAADYVQLQDVKDFCIEYLKTSLSTTNCLDALTAYSLYMPESSRDHIYLFISDNFDAVFEQEKFKNLTTNDLTILLCKLNKNKVNPQSMFLAIISWVEHREEHRKDIFSSLFGLIDLSQLSAEFIENFVINNTFLEQNVKCLKSVLSAVTTKLKHAGIAGSNRNTSTKGCSAILCLGGVNKSSVAEVFSVSGKIGAKYPDLPKQVCWHRAVKVGNLIFCVGGDNADIFRSSMHHIDLTDGDRKWSEAASMIERRRFHAAAVFKGNIVVCGNSLNDGFSTEMYEINSNKWRTLQSMNTGRSGHALVVCNNCLFAIGGEKKVRLQSVEKLNDLELKWEAAQPMTIPRNRLAAVCLDGVMYAIGGRSDSKYAEKRVEKLAPAENKKWSYVSDMNTARWGHAACVMGGKIYVIGGKDERGNFVTTIECYDPKIDSWSIVAQNVVELEGHDVVVV